VIRWFELCERTANDSSTTALFVLSPFEPKQEYAVGVLGNGYVASDETPRTAAVSIDMKSYLVAQYSEIKALNRSGGEEFPPYFDNWSFSPPEHSCRRKPSAYGSHPRNFTSARLSDASRCAASSGKILRARVNGGRISPSHQQERVDLPPDPTGNLSQRPREPWSLPFAGGLIDVGR